MKRHMQFCIFFGLLAVLASACIVLFLPHDRETKNLSIFILKLLPFVFSSFAIALVDVDLMKRFKLVFPIFVACFLFVFCILIPKIFFYMDDFRKAYFFFQVMVPFFILSIVLAYRLGGASPASSLRLAFVMLCFMISGIEDLAFLVINKHTDPRFTPIPEIWTWASHIKVRLGHFPTRYEAYAFISFHILLGIFVAVYPFNFLKRFNKYFIS